MICQTHWKTRGLKNIRNNKFVCTLSPFLYQPFSVFFSSIPLSFSVCLSLSFPIFISLLSTTKRKKPINQFIFQVRQGVVPGEGLRVPDPAARLPLPGGTVLHHHEAGSERHQTNGGGDAKGWLGAGFQTFNSTILKALNIR